MNKESIQWDKELAKMYFDEKRQKRIRIFGQRKKEIKNE